MLCLLYLIYNIGGENIQLFYNIIVGVFELCFGKYCGRVIKEDGKFGDCGVSNVIF